MIDIDFIYEQECALNNEPSKPYQVIVKHNNQIDRAYCLGFTHPNGMSILVEYFLPVNGLRIGWAKNGPDNVSGCSFRQLAWNESVSEKTAIKIEFLKAYNFHIPPNTLIDEFGYAYLTTEQQDEFWVKFRNNNKKEKV